MAKKESALEKASESLEVLGAPVKPSPSEGLQEIADWYFLLHSEDLKKVNVDTIIVCEDGEIFYDNIKGANAAVNYCRTKGIGSSQFKK
jgi:hypothetical protein